MPAYYNENNAFAAAWLRELIKAKLIADGDVDDRSIKEVQPADIKDYTQCHFFAGIGVWSYSLRNAGFPDNRKVWTGSCPCQPFSAAGRQKGFDDERHLWPDWFRLIRECKPDTIFGEQVASKAGLAWFDLVSTDLEGSGYTVGAADLCAASVGAPHIRQRLYFVADSGSRTGKWGTRAISGTQEKIGSQDRPQYGHLLDRSSNGGETDILAHTQCTTRESRRSTIQSTESIGAPKTRASVEFGRCSNLELLDNATDTRRQGEREYRSGPSLLSARSKQPSAVNGFWSNADWISCIDEKVRAVEPGTFPLAHGVKNRVGLLRGYGNSLVAPVAQAFIEAYLEVETDAI